MQSITSANRSDEARDDERETHDDHEKNDHDDDASLTPEKRRKQPALLNELHDPKSRDAD